MKTLEAVLLPYVFNISSLTVRENQKDSWIGERE